MNSYADKYLIITTDKDNKHYKPATRDDMFRAYFNRCNIHINTVYIDIDKALRAYREANVFSLTIRDMGLYLDDINIGNVYYSDWFNIQTFFLPQNFLHLILHMKQLGENCFEMYASKNHTMLKFVSDSSTILIAMKKR